jgi:uncharacterized phage protein (TIGR02220 family)
LSGKPDELSQNPDVKSVKSAAKEAAKRIIEYLNARAGTKYQCTDSNLKFPIARMLTDHVTESDIKAVIDAKCKEWLGNPDLRKYLRPETLFNATKFSQYFGQLALTTPASRENTHCVVLVIGQSINGQERVITTFQARDAVNAEDIARQTLKNRSLVDKQFPSNSLKNLIVEYKQFGQQFRRLYSISELPP